MRTATISAIAALSTLFMLGSASSLAADTQSTETQIEEEKAKRDSLNQEKDKLSSDLDNILIELEERDKKIQELELQIQELEQNNPQATPEQQG